MKIIISCSFTSTNTINMNVTDIEKHYCDHSFAFKFVKQSITIQHSYAEILTKEENSNSAPGERERELFHSFTLYLCFLAHFLLNQTS